MRITKCDICKEIIKDGQKAVNAGLGWSTKELCIKCGKPIVQFLLRKQLISEPELLKLKY